MYNFTQLLMFGITIDSKKQTCVENVPYYELCKFNQNQTPFCYISKQVTRELAKP